MSSACLHFRLHSAEKANILLISPLVHLPAVGRLTLLFVLLTHWQIPFLCHSELIMNCWKDPVMMLTCEWTLCQPS